MAQSRAAFWHVCKLWGAKFADGVIREHIGVSLTGVVRAKMIGVRANPNYGLRGTFANLARAGQSGSSWLHGPPRIEN